MKCHISVAHALHRTSGSCPPWVFRQKSRMPQALVTFLLTTAIATHLCLGQLTTTTTTTTTITTILHVFKFKYLILLQNLKLKSEIHDSWIDYRSTVNAWCRVCTSSIFNLSLQNLTIGYIALKLSWKLEFWFHFICPDIISLVGNFKANSDISNIFIKLSAFCSTVFGKVIIGPFV